MQMPECPAPMIAMRVVVVMQARWRRSVRLSPCGKIRRAAEGGPSGARSTPGACDVRSRCVGAVAPRRRQHSGRARRLRCGRGARRPCGRTATRGLHAHVPRRIPRRSGNTSRMRRLGQAKLDQHRDAGLEPLAEPALAGPEEQVFATCWLMVLAPRTRRPRSRSASALSICLKSKPWWNGNCWSSAAITASGAYFRDLVPVPPLVPELVVLVEQPADRSRSMNAGGRRVDPAQGHHGEAASRPPTRPGPAAACARHARTSLRRFATDGAPVCDRRRSIRRPRDLACARDLDRSHRHVLVAGLVAGLHGRHLVHHVHGLDHVAEHRIAGAAAARVEEGVVHEVDEELRGGAVPGRWCGPSTACRGGS